MVNIYPSITTTTDDWKEKVEEVGSLGLTEVAVFPTNIDYQKRKLLYELLQKTAISHVPLVHIKDDMTREEVLFFINKYNTKKFNIHSQKNGEKFILKNDLSEFSKMIYLEFTKTKLENELTKYAGICLDTTHVENQRIKKNQLYESFMSDLKKYPIGVAHISAIMQSPKKDAWSSDLNFDSHKFSNLNEFNYVKNYKKFLPDITCIELENTISEQLEVKSYLEKLLC